MYIDDYIESVKQKCQNSTECDTKYCEICLLEVLIEKTKINPYCYDDILNFLNTFQQSFDECDKICDKSYGYCLECFRKKESIFIDYCETCPHNEEWSICSGLFCQGQFPETTGKKCPHYNDI